MVLVTGLTVLLVGIWVFAFRSDHEVIGGASGQYTNGVSFQPINAEQIIDGCLKISEEDRDSGVTGRARSGMARTVGCLEVEVVNQLQALFPEGAAGSFPDGTPKSKAGIEKLIAEMGSSYQGLQWSIWNEHRGCDPCGTMYQLFHIGKYASLLEEILREVVGVRNEYRY